MKGGTAHRERSKGAKLAWAPPGPGTLAVFPSKSQIEEVWCRNASAVDEEKS